MTHTTLTAAALLAALALIGCNGDGDSAADSGDETTIIGTPGQAGEDMDGGMSVEMEGDAQGSADAMPPSGAQSAAGLAAAFADAENGEILYRGDDFAEVKSAGGTRLLVVSPDNVEDARTNDKELVSGEDFKLIGASSPIPGVTVLGENELKDAFYARHGL